MDMWKPSWVGAGRLLAALLVVTAFMRSLAAENPINRVTTNIDFNRDIRPILSDNSFKCHCPDDKERKAELRLDTKEGALQDVIVPGKSADSALIERLTTADKSMRMPPAKSGKKLTAKQIDLVKQWIDQGAKWSNHWA